MSFLSKRSRSTKSFIRGEDTITVRRLEPVQDAASGRSRASSESCHSEVSAPPYINTTDYALNESCVLRKFPKHKSSHLRFLAWVAYTRKFTDEAITEDERRTCPLLWCRHVFESQEEMLQHVWNCEYLSKGLYWCFHCQRPERVGKYQCKRCQGVPSRTDRLASVAKKIFSKLGTKSHRSYNHAPTPEPDMAIAKYPESKSQPEYPEIFDAGPVPWDQQYGCGQSSSTGNGGRDLTGSLELPDSQIAEMCGSSYPLELSAGPDTWLNPFATPQQDWFLPEQPAPIHNPAPKSSKRPETMLPLLDTHSLCPSRQNGSQRPTVSDEPMAATIISPLSATGRTNFYGSSPTDTEISGRSFHTNDSGYTSGTMVSTMSSSSATNFELDPTFNEPRGKKRSRDSAEEIGLNQPDPSSTQPASKGLKSNVGSVNSTHSPSRCPSTKKPKLQSPHWSGAPSLVQAFSEILDAHISHTKETLRLFSSTPVTDELLAMSRTSMVSIGLEALAGIIEGRNPTAIVQAFAFTHIAYAFAIAIDHDEIKVHTQEWFQDSLSWVEDLGSERQRSNYTQIAKAIWQPVDSLREKSLPHLFTQGDKENRLFLACKKFLDALESFGPAKDSSKIDRVFDFTQALFVQKAKTQVIDELITTVSIEAFIEDVIKVERRLNRGRIANVRELELELMCAGKLASQSEVAYTRFLDHVTHLCNTLYAGDPAKARSLHHIKDIALVKQLLPEELYCDFQDNYDIDFELELEDDLPLGCNIMPTEEGCVDGFKRNVDEILCISTPAPVAPHRPTPSPLHNASTSAPTPTVPTPQPTHSSPAETPAYSTPAAAKDLKCPICAYVPTGEEKWKASNLRRHKRTQHPSQNKKEWRCKWPGCESVFTRSDNLRSHARDKNHFVEGTKGFEEEFWKGKGKERVIDDDSMEIDERPVKKRKGKARQE